VGRKRRHRAVGTDRASHRYRPADQAGPEGSRPAAMGPVVGDGNLRCPSRSKARSCSRKRRQSGECRLSSSARAAKLRRQAPPRRASG